MWWEIRHCHVYLVVMRREKRTEPAVECYGLWDGQLLVKLWTVTTSVSAMTDFTDEVSLALFICTISPRCYKGLQDFEINLCVSHCSCQIHDAHMRLSSIDVFRFHMLLIRISQVFCSDSMINAFLTPVKLQSSMIFLWFLCCALPILLVQRCIESWIGKVVLLCFNDV